MKDLIEKIDKLLGSEKQEERARKVAEKTAKGKSTSDLETDVLQLAAKAKRGSEVAQFQLEIYQKELLSRKDSMMSKKEIMAGRSLKKK